MRHLLDSITPFAFYLAQFSASQQTIPLFLLYLPPFFAESGLGAQVSSCSLQPGLTHISYCHVSPPHRISTGVFLRGDPVALTSAVPCNVYQLSP